MPMSVFIHLQDPLHLSCYPLAASLGRFQLVSAQYPEVFRYLTSTRSTLTIAAFCACWTAAAAAIDTGDVAAPVGSMPPY